MGEIVVEEKLNLLAGQVYASAGIGMWCFSPDGKLYYSTCPHQKEFGMFLKLGGCMDFALGNKSRPERPMILSDSIGMLWGAEYVLKEKTPIMLVMMGPFFISEMSLKKIEDDLRSREISVQTRRQLTRVIAEAPILSYDMINQYVLLMHFTLTGEKTNSFNFIYQNNPHAGKSAAEEMEERTNSRAPAAAEAERMVRKEAVFLKAVREGREELLGTVSPEDKGMERSFTSQTGDAIRDAKNTVLVFSALCSRAAIEGGLPVRTAKKMETEYTGKIEQCNTVTELTNLNLEMVGDYIRRVRQIRMQTDISSAVREACDYIRGNVTQPLTVEKIAADLGYTPYYFTRKFSKEMDMKVTDYIKQARIEYAQMELVTTSKGISEISDSLHFGSRNYFTRIFREITGMTPAAYREKYRRGGEKSE